VTSSTDDVRIREIKALITPRRVIGEFPPTEHSAGTVAGARTALSHILHHTDDRLAVVIGPCSIHDPSAAIEYATRL
jgi:3-deoxy-7-phosphoheptulonate synthase